MESLFQLTVARGAPVRILQITDTHLFAGEHETLLGVNTHRSYHAVLEAIHAEARPYDIVVATGDLAQDHSVAAYQHFATVLRRLIKPVCGFRVIMIFSQQWSIRWPMQV